MAQNSNIPLQELIVTLEQATSMVRQLPATSMVRQLPTTSDPTLLHQIYSTLHHANHSISTFLAAPPPPPHPSAENSHSSATGADPMQLGDDSGEEGLEANSRNTAVDRVEEGMRNCFIRNKRLKKRRLSPSAADDTALRDDTGGPSIPSPQGGELWISCVNFIPDKTWKFDMNFQVIENLRSGCSSVRLCETPVLPIS